MTETGIHVTPSEVIEYLYCPRFIYFMDYLKIPQHEERRYKVIVGREMHNIKAKVNKDYVRKKIGCIKKEIDVDLISSKLRLRGVVDEVLTLKDGTMVPLDYKFAKFSNYTYRTHRYQSALYGLLIKENYNREVNRGYVCYIRSKNLLKEIPFDDKVFNQASKYVDDVIDIVKNGYFPERTSYSRRCIDCTYRNICV